MRDAMLAQSWLPDLDVSRWSSAFIEWLRDNLPWVFDPIRVTLNSLVRTLEYLLVAPPSWVIIAVFVVIALLATSWRFALFTAIAFLVIESMGHFELTMLSLALVLVATLISVLVGIPLGILASRRQTVSALLRPALDFMQTMPAFVYLLIAVVLFRVGVVPGVIASVLFSMPPAVRLTELGIRRVDAEAVEAAHAFGARPSSVLTGVQLPLALPTIMAGVNQVIMLSLSMVVIAGLSGAGGLGGLIVEGITRLQIGRGIEGGLAIVILAIFLDRVTAGLGKRFERSANL